VFGSVQKTRVRFGCYSYLRTQLKLLVCFSFHAFFFLREPFNELFVQNAAIIYVVYVIVSK